MIDKERLRWFLYSIHTSDAEMSLEMALKIIERSRGNDGEFKKYRNHVEFDIGDDPDALEFADKVISKFLDEDQHKDITFYYVK